MKRYINLMALASTLALGATGAAQQPAPPLVAVPVPSVRPELYRLRNVAAADVAGAIKQFATAKKLTVNVVVEPVTNSIVVAADPAVQKVLEPIIVKLDSSPTQVVAQVLVMSVGPGFAETAGLSENASKNESLWVLTPREARMLNALIRDAKGRGEVDVLSRPQVMVADNQTAVVKVGDETAANGVALKLTPRVLSERMSVRCELQVNFQDGPTTQTTSQANAEFPDGGTIILRSSRQGDEKEILTVMTFHKVAH